MDDAKVEGLRQICRDLAAYLENQHKVINNDTVAIAAIRAVLDREEGSRKAYRESLQNLRDDVTIQPTPAYARTFEELLKRLAEW